MKQKPQKEVIRKNTYKEPHPNLQNSAHLGGLVTFSRPQGTVRTVEPQKHFTSTWRGHG